MDLANGQIVEDVNINQSDGSAFHVPLPLGTENVETRFYYQMEDDDPEINAVETDGGNHRYYVKLPEMKMSGCDRAKEECGILDISNVQNSQECADPTEIQ